MRFEVVTLFPEFVESVARYGVTGRAVDAGRLAVRCWNPRAFTHDRHRTVDDRPYGGGPGMVMKAEPLAECLDAVRDQAGPARVVHLSPQGRMLDQAAVRRLAGEPALILLAGRYEGVDERLIDSRVDEELSIGDYVLSGGELPAMVLIDACARQIPGVLGDADSAAQDSFADGLLDCPHYTRPEVFEGRDVPAVLLSGDHGAVARWRRKQSLGRTWQRRPELLAAAALSEEDERLLREYCDERGAINEHAQGEKGDDHG